MVWMEAAKRRGLTYVAVASGTVADVLGDRMRDIAVCAIVTSVLLLSVVRDAVASMQSDCPASSVTIVAVPLDSSTGTGGDADTTAAPFRGNGSGAVLADSQRLVRVAFHALTSLREQSNSPLAEDSPTSDESTRSSAHITDVPLLWRLVSPSPVEASHPLFVLYTSGSTGKPKGIVHVSATRAALCPHSLSRLMASHGSHVCLLCAGPWRISGWPDSYLRDGFLTAIPGRDACDCHARVDHRAVVHDCRLIAHAHALNHA